MTRRIFKDDKVVETLADFAEATVDAANTEEIKYLDLNRASTDYVNAICQKNAEKYNRDPGDITHLNAAGESVFGRMTLDLLLEEREDLNKYFRANKALSDKISNGEFAPGRNQSTILPL